MSAPVLASPSNGASGQFLTLTLSWTKVTDAASYDVQISTDSGFTAILGADSMVTGDSTIISAIISGLSLDSSYYWRARAGNGAGNGSWSGAWQFTTMAVTSFTGMRRLAGGTFTMGEPDLADTPAHPVTLSPFYIDTAPVTQAAYQSLMGVNPAAFAGALQNPVEQVTWYDAVLYCNARSKRDAKDSVYSYTSISGIPGNGCTGLGNLTVNFANNGYRLPTEAEYEFAYRAGGTTDYYWGKDYPLHVPTDTVAKDTVESDTSALDSNAVWYGNSPNGTQPVATKKPNAFTLYDMAGNVWEWCYDRQGSYSSGSQTNPTGPATGNNRIVRGGSWVPGGAFTLCAGYRGVSSPVYQSYDVGFRVVCNAP
jgi:formylglycine-generating enzyme required for sulfatase activity